MDGATAINLAHEIERQLPPPLLQVLRHAAEVAEQMGAPCYLVGGPVRDLLLRRPVDDLDLVLEGDAVAVAECFAEETGGRVVRHPAFGTAAVSLPENGHALDVDFVTARNESYPAPAALPVVRPSGIEDDLRRRDFTINTLALSLTRATWGTLLDPHDGQADLRRGLIRVLHDRSFVDDPTRILRAARFAARLGNDIEAETRGRIRAAVEADMIERTSPIRILHELALCFREPAPDAVLTLLDEMGALARILPGLGWRSELGTAIEAIRAEAAPEDERRRLMLGLLTWQISAADRYALLRRYPLSGDEQRLMAEIGTLDDIRAAMEARPLRPSEIDRLLRELGDTALRLLALRAPDEIGRTVEQYRREIRPVRPLLNGDDLKALGIPPGPRYRALLDGLRAAQLDGDIRTRVEAEQWVRGQDAG